MIGDLLDKWVNLLPTSQSTPFFSWYLPVPSLASMFRLSPTVSRSAPWELLCFVASLESKNPHSLIIFGLF